MSALEIFKVVIYAVSVYNAAYAIYGLVSQFALSIVILYNKSGTILYKLMGLYAALLFLSLHTLNMLEFR